MAGYHACLQRFYLSNESIFILSLIEMKMFSKQCLSLLFSTFSLFLTLSCRVNVVLMVLEFSIRKMIVFIKSDNCDVKSPVLVHL